MNKPDIYHHLVVLQLTITPALEHAYAALNILSIALLGLLLGTVVWSKRLKRDPTLLNTFIVVILVDLGNILYYLVRGGNPLGGMITDSGAGSSSANAGARDGDAGGGAVELPMRGVCRAQACLMAGSQAAQAAAVFSMCLQLWFSLMQLEHDFFYRVKNRLVLISLLALPYLCILAFVPPMIISSGRKPELLTPSPFYCSLNDSTLRSVYSKLALVFSALCLLLELHMIYLVISRFRKTSRIKSNHPHNSLLDPDTDITITIQIQPTRQAISPVFIIRVGLFMVWTMSMIMATLYQAFDDGEESPVSDFIFACVGLLAFLCFASQPDILRVWGSKRLAKFWTVPAQLRRNHEKEGRAGADDGWSDFLGRDESHLTLPVTDPESPPLRTDPAVDTNAEDKADAVGAGTVSSEKVMPGVIGEDRVDEEYRAGEELDTLAILDRGPSR